VPTPIKILTMSKHKAAHLIWKVSIFCKESKMSLLLSTKGQVGSTSTFNENLLHVHSGGKTATAQSTKETSKDI